MGLIVGNGILKAKRLDRTPIAKFPSHGVAGSHPWSLSWKPCIRVTVTAPRNNLRFLNGFIQLVPKVSRVAGLKHSRTLSRTDAVLG